MLQKKILNSVILTMLMCLSFTAHANRDSARIGISVESKASLWLLLLCWEFS